MISKEERQEQHARMTRAQKDGVYVWVPNEANAALIDASQQALDEARAEGFFLPQQRLTVPFLVTGIQTATH
jgi:hypothetical protein